jgi:hypothetical protein
MVSWLTAGDHPGGRHIPGELAQAPRAVRQAQVTGAAPGDQPDLTDRPRPAPAPSWFQRPEADVVEGADHPTHVLPGAVQQVRDVRHGLPLRRSLTTTS